MESIHGNTWTGAFAGPLTRKPVAVDQRIEVLLQEVFSRGVAHPESKVIVLPAQGEAKLTELKTIAVFADARSCELLQSSEWAIKAYMEWNKAFLQETNNWAKYLQTLQSFARQENGILDKYLDSELSKEAIKAILKNQVTDNEKKTLCELMKRAFASAETLDMSDLYILDQIPRLDLMKEEYLNGKLPVPLDKIKAAVHDLATKALDISDPSNPSLFKDLSLWLIDSTAEGNKKEAVNRIISAWVQGSTSLFLSGFGLTKIPPQIGQLVNLQKLLLDHNHLESLPNEIGQLVNLQRLDLNNNNLQSVPTEIGQLANLQWLYLYNNNLQSIPIEIGQLANLNRLEMNDNNLQSLPTSIGQLLRLDYLTIWGNPNLRDLPMSLGNIPGLTDLYIEDTQIPQKTVHAILRQCRVMRKSRGA